MRESQAAFARRLEVSRSHVTRLKQAGRLVMDGKQVLVDASLKRLAATESPLARDEANRQRFAEARAEGGAEPAVHANAGALDDSLEAIGLQMKKTQAAKLAAEASIAQMQRDEMARRLVDADRVRAAALSTGPKIRDQLEGLPDRYAAELAATTDTAQAHAILAEAIELVLASFAREAQAIADELVAP